MTMRMLGTLLLLGAFATTAGAQGAQFHLASAQVVTGDGPPMLRLAASGPVAHAVEPEADGSATPADRLRLRLYGLTPTAGFSAEVVAPYTLQATADGRDTILVVSAPGLASGARLAVGTAARASELLIVVR
jgi:hypothetical protein